MNGKIIFAIIVGLLTHNVVPFAFIVVPLTHNVGPGQNIVANNVGREMRCLRVLVIMFAGRYKYRPFHEASRGSPERGLVHRTARHPTAPP